MERRAVVESNHHRKSRDHCQPKHYRKTLDEVLRVEREGASHGAFKVLVKCGETYCVGNAGTCGPQSADRHRKKSCHQKLYSTCASPVVPHPSTGHAHGCLASEIGRDPAFPTRFDRTVDSPEVSLLAPSTTSP